MCKPRGRGRNDTFPVDRETRSRLTARLLGFARGTGPGSGGNTSLSEVEGRREAAHRYSSQAAGGGRPPPHHHHPPIPRAPRLSSRFLITRSRVQTIAEPPPGPSLCSKAAFFSFDVVPTSSLKGVPRFVSWDASRNIKMQASPNLRPLVDGSIP